MRRTPPSSFLLSRCWRRLAAGLAALVVLGQGLAQAQAPAAARADHLVEDSQVWLDQAIAAAKTPGDAALRMEVSVGSLDSRLRLAPCAAVEPFVPPGMRLWGRTRLGLRCTDGTVRWNVYLPVQVKAFGQAWVLQRDVPAGTTLSEADAMLEEVDWAQERHAVLADPADWVGQTAARTLTVGQAIRQGMTRPTQVFAAGADVRIVAKGPGFTVSSDGKALSPGVVGTPARVRIDSGRILSGVVLDNRTVQVEL